jgi:dolichol-phosphate mannosyltransferase
VSGYSFPNSPTGLTVLIPAYNELENLRIVIPNVWKATKKLVNSNVEILVVLPKIASNFEISEIKSMGGTVVIRKPSDSFGDALRSGFNSTSDQTEFIITMDGDGSHDPELLVTLLEKSKAAHIVCASRYISGGQSDAKRRQQIMSRLLNFAFALVVGEKIHDISGNYKMYRKSIVSNLNLTGQNFDIIQEIVFKTKKYVGASFNLVEVPYRFNERIEGKPKRKLIPYIISYLKLLIKLAIIRIKP